MAYRGECAPVARDDTSSDSSRYSKPPRQFKSLFDVANTAKDYECLHKLFPLDDASTRVDIDATAKRAKLRSDNDE